MTATACNFNSAATDPTTTCVFATVGTCERCSGASDGTGTVVTCPNLRRASNKNTSPWLWWGLGLGAVVGLVIIVSYLSKSKKKIEENQPNEKKPLLFSDAATSADDVTVDMNKIMF